MKIVEKKCPNCGANLDFKVGERDVTCGHCRRKYAVEYDGTDFSRLTEDAVKSLKDINIDLRPVAHYLKIAFGIGIAMIVCFCIFVGVMIFKSHQAMEESREEFERTVEESDREFNERVRGMQDEYERNVEEMRNR